MDTFYLGITRGDPVTIAGTVVNVGDFYIIKAVDYTRAQFMGRLLFGHRLLNALTQEEHDSYQAIAKKFSGDPRKTKRYHYVSLLDEVLSTLHSASR